MIYWFGTIPVEVHMSGILDASHILYRAAPAVREICLPLERFLNIKEFTYEKVFKNNLKIRLSNQPEWMRYYYQHQFHLVGDYEKSIEQLESGCYVTVTMECQEIFQHRKKLFNIGDGILLIEHRNEYCEMYWFLASADDRQALNVYLNNIQLLRMFIPFFKEKAAKLLKRAEKEKILIPPRVANKEKVIKDAKAIRKAFLYTIRAKNYNLPTGVVLTEQEFKCAMHLIKGKTARQISEELALSRRTIEAYTDRLKVKLDCATKAELVCTLLNGGMYAYLG